VKHNVHDRIEAIAGAIALNEATDEERREYREHIASCAQCLEAFGGEHLIERVASTVACAREAEVWAPEIGDVVATRTRRRSRVLRYGAGFAGVAVAAAFGIHIATTSPQSGRLAAVPVVTVATVKPAPAQLLAAAPRRLIVTHNVVQIARAPVSDAAVTAATQTNDTKPRQLVTMTVHPEPTAAPPRAENATPVWRRADTAWRTVAQTTTTSVTETAPQTLTHSAESLQVANLPSRDVAPVGGESAINPQPAMIAYDEGAEGTSVFEVLVDERGIPTKCVITKSAGYPVLDDAVCKAAMKARYTPKIVEGRAVPGVYRDAFTFHMSDQTSANIDGLPHVANSLAAGPARRHTGSNPR
jgi:TonB family protein